MGALPPRQPLPPSASIDALVADLERIQKEVEAELRFQQRYLIAVVVFVALGFAACLLMIGQMIP